ncbi:MAG: hypothetical protein ACE5LC_06820 [Candidatus Aminicenantales bacterium]
MKKPLPILILCAAAVIIGFILQKVGCSTMSSEELVNSIEIVDVETKWVAKYYQPWPPKLILVPAISFRVKNITDKPLRYINFNTNFRFKNDYEHLGNCFLAAIRNKPVLPGEKSDVITLKSNFGVEGKTIDSFKNNPQWKVVVVELFAQSKGSQHTPLGTWEVSRKIDFTPPKPVHMGEEKEKREEKKK